MCLYIVGAYSAAKNLWPIPILRQIKSSLKVSIIKQSPIPTEERQVTVYGRYEKIDTKTEISCPRQTDNTVVALVFGQSNAANSHGQRILQNSPRIVNLFNGKCYVASDPLLGASGNAGSVWTLLGTKLIATGKYDNIIFVPAGMGGSAIKSWAQGGELNAMLGDVIQVSQPKYNFTHIIWHQGESDLVVKTTKDEYKQNFYSMLKTIRDNGVNRPIHVSIATIFGDNNNPDNPISKAQRELIDGNGIKLGPNTDKLNAPEDRYDDAHVSYTGMHKFADLLLLTVFN